MAIRLSDSSDTNVWRSSRGVQFSPIPAFRQIARSDQRTLPASSLVPRLGGEHKPLFLPEFTRPQAGPGLVLLVFCERRHGVVGSARERRDMLVFTSPWARTERHTSFPLRSLPGSTGAARAAPLPQPRPAIERPPEVPPAPARRVRRGHRRHPRPGRHRRDRTGPRASHNRSWEPAASRRRGLPSAESTARRPDSPLRAVVTVNDGNPVPVTRRAQRRRSQRGRYHTDRHPGAGATGAYQHTHR